MLIKAKNVVGRRVVTLDKGQKIEDVDDVIYDPREQRVKALLVKKGGLFSNAMVVPFDSIRSIGRDAIIVDSPAALKNATDLGPDVARVSSDGDYLTRTRVLTDTGDDLGKVSDILFDDKTGQVEELEVSQGLRDIQSGKKHIKVSDIVNIGKDTTIVKVEAEEEVARQEQEQGLQGAVSRGAAAVTGVVGGVAATAQKPETKRKVEETTEEVKGRAGELYDKAKEKIKKFRTSLKEDQKNATLGKYLKINLVGPNDEIIAKRGDVITHEVINKAESMGFLDQVLDNATTNPPIK